jgi:hypothetical protein
MSECASFWQSGVLSFLVLLCWLCDVLRYQCRFFTPTILFLKSRGHNIHILCVSLGKVASLLSCMSLFSLHVQEQACLLPFSWCQNIAYACTGTILMKIYTLSITTIVAGCLDAPSTYPFKNI